MKVLEKDEYLSIKVSNRCSVVTICKYSTYQDAEMEDVQEDVQDVSRTCPGRVQDVSTNKKEQEGKEGKEEEEHASSDDDADDAFTTWWATYPRKVGKQAAEPKYALAIRRIQRESELAVIDAQALLLGITQQFAASPRGNGRFCPNPATWLNQGRYDDDPKTWEDSGELHDTSRRKDPVSGQVHSPDGRVR